MIYSNFTALGPVGVPADILRFLYADILAESTKHPSGSYAEEQGGTQGLAL